MEVSEKSSADSTAERPLLLPHHSHLTPLLFFGRSHRFRFLSSRPLSPSPCYLFCPPVLSFFLSHVRTLTYSLFPMFSTSFLFPFPVSHCHTHDVCVRRVMGEGGGGDWLHVPTTEEVQSVAVIRSARARVYGHLIESSRP